MIKAWKSCPVETKQSSCHWLQERIFATKRTRGCTRDQFTIGVDKVCRWAQEQIELNHSWMKECMSDLQTTSTSFIEWLQLQTTPTTQGCECDARWRWYMRHEDGRYWWHVSVDSWKIIRGAIMMMQMLETRANLNINFKSF